MTGHDVPGRNVQKVYTADAQLLREPKRVFRRHRVGQVIRCRHPHPQRTVLRPCCPDGFDDLQRKARTANEIAPVVMRSTVCYRREEFMQQVAVCGMDFYQIKTRVDSACHGCAISRN